MSQQDPSIASGQSGTNYRTQDNAGKVALMTNHKGNSAPSYLQAGMTWLDDSATPWVMKFYDGADWIPMFKVDTSGNVITPYPFGGLTMAQGDIFYYNGSAIVNLGPGTSGHFLKTQGAAANPVWAAAPTYDESSVAITGGTINGTVIGGTTPAAATISSLTLAAGVAVTSILDEDTMSSNSATALATQQSIKAYVDGAVSSGFPAPDYESAETTITSGSEHSFTHSLGALPEHVKIEYVCKTAEQGYVVGEVIEDPGGHSNSGSEFGAVISKTSTNVYVRVGNNGVRVFDTAGQNIDLTLANWKMVVKAWT